MQAGQVRHGTDTDFVLHAMGEVERGLGANAGARDRYEIGMQRFEFIDGAKKQIASGVVFGREELEGKQGSLLIKQAVDAWLLGNTDRNANGI